jgi:HPt (histidine-containing phosphotransfer) domain-containing protein
MAKLRRAAHTLKGSAAIFSARRTTAAAGELENLAKAGDLAKAAAAISDLESEAMRLTRSLEKQLGARTNGK